MQKIPFKMNYRLPEQALLHLVGFLAEFDGSAFLEPRHPTMEGMNTIPSVDSLASDKAQGGGVLGVDGLKL